MNELEKEIDKRIEEIQTENPDKYALSDKKLRELINEGARIQQEFDSICLVQEMYCIDDFEEAKSMWKSIVENTKLIQIHKDKNETIPVKDCECMACVNQTIYDNRMKEFKYTRDKANEAAEKAAGRWD